MFLAISGCANQKPTPSESSQEKELIHIDSYVADVSATAPIIKSKKYQGEDVDYVVSSYPVIFRAKTETSKIYSNVAKDFGNRYHTNGFPQAALFMRSDLMETTTENELYPFLSYVDTYVDDLVFGGKIVAQSMFNYSSSSGEQQARFGLTDIDVLNCQHENGMAFIRKRSNPLIEDFQLFEEPLGISFSESDFSTYYSTTVPEDAAHQDTKTFTVTTPLGAPSVVFSGYFDQSSVTITSPVNVRQAFASKTSDFIVFDSVNGVKLSKANNNSYKLVRMLTFGNLYVVATGNDDNDHLDESDLIVGYGENLVPDLAFKAVYSK